jgi:hypothetical protein
MSIAARPAERSFQHDTNDRESGMNGDFSSLPAVLKMDRTNLGECRTHLPPGLRGVIPIATIFSTNTADAIVHRERCFLSMCMVAVFPYR